jgi:nucleolar protein 56
MAAGVLFGETTPESTNIVGSILFDNDESMTKESLNEFLYSNEDRINEALSDIEEEVVSDNALIIDYLRQKGYRKVRFAASGELFPFRSKIREYITDKLNLDSPSEITQLIRTKSLMHTQALLQEKVEARDKYIAQAINSIDDINSILNLIYARLSEWYGIHFPELQDLVRDNDQYIKLVARMEGKIRSEITLPDIESLSERRQELISEAAENSLGASISSFDMNPITQLASFGVEILKVKENLEKYIDESMKEVAPNLQFLVGSLLGARLISLAGSLENLAKRSSGTIQVLGAEKALFRHLRSGEDPPKHGVIFQSPFIHSAKKHQRGKIARALSGKLSIAARVDYFSGEFIAPTLANDLEKRIKEIQEAFPEPSELQIARKKEKSKKAKRREKGRSKKPRRKERPKSKKDGKKKAKKQKSKKS